MAKRKPAFTEQEVMELAATAKRMAHRVGARFVLEVEKLRMCGFTKRKAQQLAARFNRQSR